MKTWFHSVRALNPKMTRQKSAINPEQTGSWKEAQARIFRQSLCIGMLRSGGSNRQKSNDPVGPRVRCRVCLAAPGAEAAAGGDRLGLSTRRARQASIYLHGVTMASLQGRP